MKKAIKNGIGAMIALCTSVSLVGFGQVASAATAAKAHHYTFEFIATSNTTPYWLDVLAGAREAGKKYGDKIIFQAPSVATDISSEIGMVENAVTMHVNGLILVPYSPTALLAPTKSAQKAGIPVVTVDSSLSPNIAKTFIAVPDAKAAAYLANYAARLVGGKGQYAVIDYNTSTTSGIERYQGFKAGMSKFPRMKFAGLQISNSVIQTALSETETLLESHPHLNVIFGANDRSAIGVGEAVQQMHLTGKVKVVGFDADLGELNFIKSGVLAGSILQSPVLMGYDAVVQLLKLKAGERIPKQIPVPFNLVTSKNINTAKSVAAIRQYILNYHP